MPLDEKPNPYRETLEEQDRERSTNTGPSRRGLSLFPDETEPARPRQGLSLFPDEPDSENPYRETLEEQDRARRGLSLFTDDYDPLRFIVPRAAKTAPEQAARILRMETKTGLPTALIERNLEEVEREAARRDFDAEKFRRESPMLAKWLSENPQHAALAQDDLQNLSALERVFDVVRALPAGAMQGVGSVLSGAGRLWDITARGIGTGIRAIPVVGELAFDFLQTPIPWYLSPPSILGRPGAVLKESGKAIGPAAERQNLATDISGGIGQLTSQVATAILTGGTVTTATLFAQGADIMAERAEEAGKYGTPGADISILAGAGITALTEKYGLDVLLNRVPPAIKNAFLQKLADITIAGGVEASQEVVEGLLHNLVTKAALNPNQPLSDDLQREAMAAGGAGSIFRLLLNAIAPGRARDIGRFERAQENQTFAEQLGLAVKNSKLAGRMPEKLEEFVARATEGGPNENVYIPIETWQQYWQEQKIDPAAAAADVLGDSKPYTEAVEAGNDLAIPTGKYASKLAGTPHNAFFAKELRLAPDEWNAQEAAEFQKDQQERLEAERAAETPAPESSAAKVREDIIGQMVNMGFHRTAVEAYAQIHEAFFGTLTGERAGFDPLEFFSQYGLRINRPLPEVLTKIGTLDALDVMLDRLRGKDIPGQDKLFGKTLIEYLRSRGGVVDETGDLESSEVDVNRKPFQKKLINPEGSPLDVALVSVKEEGYLPDEATIDDLMDAIYKDQRTKSVYKLEAVPPEAVIQLNQLEDYLGTLGVDVASMDNAAIKELLTKAAAQPEGGMEFEQAVGGIMESPKIIRYYVAPAPTLRGWYVRSVVLEGGREIDGGVVATVSSKKEAHAQKDKLNRGLTEGQAETPDAGDLSFEQRKGKDKRAEFRIRPGKAEINLFKKADLSSMIHESSHFWLEVIGDVVAKLKAQDPATLTDQQRKIISDYDGVILPWFGVGSRGEIKPEHHEKFARGLEAYFREGDAPSIELRRVFARFRAWLVSIYRTVAQLDVELTPEVRAMMDRLFATDQAIEEAQKEAWIRPLFLTAEQAGMSEREFAAYNDVTQDASDKARDRLEANARAVKEREQQAYWKEQREKVREEVAAEVYRMPEYIALSELQRGTRPDGSPLPEGLKAVRLDRKSIVSSKGEGFLKKLPRPYVYTKADGIDPDIAAERYGFRSGEELLLALVNARPMNTLIDAETDLLMRERHGDPGLDSSIDDQATAAVHNEERRKVLYAEVLALRKKQREVAPFVRAERQEQLAQMRAGMAKLRAGIPSLNTIIDLAQRQIAGTRIRDIRPRTYLAAQRRAARKAFQALARHDIDTALESKLQELMSLELYRNARDAQGQIEDARAKFADMFRPDAKVAKSHNMDYVAAARAIASHYMFPGHKESVLEALDNIRKYDPDVYDVLKDKITAAVAGGENLKDLSFENFVGVRDTILSLWAMSRREQQIKIEGQLIEREEIKGKLRDRLSEFDHPNERAGYKRALSKWEKLELRFLTLKDTLRRVESWVDAMDGGKPDGVFRKFIWTPISEAVTAYRVQKNATMRQYLEIVKGVEKTMTHAKIDAPEIDYTFNGKAELLHALLHSGNESNLSKLLRGRGWGQYRSNGTLNDSRWRAFIARMHRAKVLTKADYDYAQGVWDLLEAQKPAAQLAHKEMYGHYFHEITAQEIETPWGTYRGGYVPAIADPDITPAADIRQGKNALSEDGNSAMFPAAPRGFTKSRIEMVAEPLAMNLAYIPVHIDKVLRFAFIGPRVKDIGRLIFDRGFREGLDTHDPKVAGSMLVPWLQRAATQQVARSGDTDISRVMGKFFSEVRKRAGLQLMVANVTNTLQQFAGLPIAALKVKPRYLRNALWEYVRNPRKTTALVNEKSDFMATRTTSQAFEIQKTIDDLLLDPNAFEKARDFATKHGYFMQQGTQNIVDVITWTGAYSEASEGGAEDAAAVRAADSAVRLTQGSFAAEDISAAESGHPLVRSLMMFYSYYNMQANLLGTEFGNSMRELGLKKGAGRALYVYTMGFMIPAVLSELIVKSIGGFDDDDDDSYIDEALSIFFGSQLRSGAALVPVLGPVTMAGINRWNEKFYDDRISTSPAVSLIESAVGAPYTVYKAIMDNGSWKRAVRDTLTALGLLTGLPFGAAGRPLGYLADVAQEKAEPEDALDVVRGIVSGKDVNK